TQLEEMMDEFKEKEKENGKLGDEKRTLIAQADHFSEQLKAESSAKSAAEERAATLEKEKAVLELDLTELRKQIVTSTEAAEARETELKRNLDVLSKESRDLSEKLTSTTEELDHFKAK